MRRQVAVAVCAVLRKIDVESWRFGRVSYLEKVIRCNLGKTSRILRILRMHVHDLNMTPSHSLRAHPFRGGV